MLDLFCLKKNKVHGREAWQCGKDHVRHDNRDVDTPFRDDQESHGTHHNQHNKRSSTESK